MIIGYSCWGFLGKGIADTPDGGRSHRKTLIDTLINQSVDIIMLQKNRDLLETGKDYSSKHLIYDSKLPTINALFIEYRWRLPGRNCNVTKRSSRYTPDLDRQNELINYYKACNIPILIWDKDQKLTSLEGKKIKNAIIFEPALYPRFGRKQLLFPANMKKIRVAKSKNKHYSSIGRTTDLVYIGNQYERDTSFEKYINKPAKKLASEVLVFGNWNKYPNIYKLNLRKYPNVKFKERIPFDKIEKIYNQSLATVLIAPKRYYTSGQFTQRLFESMWSLCAPLTPADYTSVKSIIIDDFIVQNSEDVTDMINRLRNLPDEQISALFAKQLKKLDMFDPAIQAKIIINEILQYNKSYKKHHGDIARYYCEKKYLEDFRRKGFHVPKIYKYNDKELCIEMEKISGEVRDKFSNEDIKLCINLLCDIVSKYKLETHNTFQANRYIKKVKSNITSWCQKNNYIIYEDKLDCVIGLLNKCCYISLFKDAKASNWIFQRDDDKISLIDFDYVKKSFFMADLAQLLSYVNLSRRINPLKYAEYFLHKVLPSCDPKLFYLPFKVAIVNSNIASLDHNNNLHKEIVIKFNKQNKVILTELNII